MTARDRGNVDGLATNSVCPSLELSRRTGPEKLEGRVSSLGGLIPGVGDGSWLESRARRTACFPLANIARN